MEIEVYLVRAFSISGQGGNLAGVVLNADGLTDKQKQSVAQCVGVSETAFVNQSDIADFSVSFFTPTTEVDFCGHATLSVFWLLHHLNCIDSGTFSQSTKVGVLPVVVKPNGDVLMTQSLPDWLAIFDVQDIAPLLRIQPAHIIQTGLPVQAISTGLADVIVPVSYGTLDHLDVDYDAITRFCQQHGFVGFHVFEMNPSGSAFMANCRNFAPAVGIPEESATGSSSGALACYLNNYLGYNHATFEQGRAMGMSSKIVTHLSLDNDDIVEVKVGGEGAYHKKLLFDV